METYRLLIFLVYNQLLILQIAPPLSPRSSCKKASLCKYLQPSTLWRKFFRVIGKFRCISTTASNVGRHRRTRPKDNKGTLLQRPEGVCLRPSPSSTTITNF